VPKIRKATDSPEINHIEHIVKNNKSYASYVVKL
jgi:hypothetical protein